MSFNTELKDFISARNAMLQGNYYATAGQTPQHRYDQDFYKSEHGREYIRERLKRGEGLPPDYDASLLETVGGWINNKSPTQGAPAQPPVQRTPYYERYRQAQGVVPGVQPQQTQQPAPPPVPLPGQQPPYPFPGQQPPVQRRAKGGVIEFQDGNTVPGIGLPPWPVTPPAGGLPQSGSPMPGQGTGNALDPGIGPNWPAPVPHGPTMPAQTAYGDRTGNTSGTPGSAGEQGQRAYNPQTDGPLPRSAGYIAPDTGQYASLGDIISGAAQWANENFLNDPGAIRGTSATSPAAATGAVALQQGVGAPSRQEVEQFDKLTMPDARRMDLALRSVRRLEFMYEYQMSRGDTDRANKSAFELIQYSNKIAADYGTAALVHAQHGDQRGAMTSVLAGLNAVADGYRYTMDPHTQKVVAVDIKTGQVAGEYPIGGEQVYRAAIGLRSGTLPWQMLQRRVSETMTDKSQKRTPLQEELTRSQIDLNRARMGHLGTKGAKVTPQISEEARRFNERLNQTPGVTPDLPTSPQAGGQGAGSPAPQGTDPRLNDALYGTTDDNHAEGGPVHGQQVERFADGDAVPPRSPFYVPLDPSIATGNQSPTLGLSATPLQPQPPDATLLEPSAGAMGQKPGEMLFMRPPGPDAREFGPPVPPPPQPPPEKLAPFDNPYYHPDLMPRDAEGRPLKFDRQGTTLTPLPTSPTVPKFPKDSPFTPEQAAAYKDLKENQLQQAHQLRIPRERTAAVAAVKAKIAGYEQVEKKFHDEKKGYEATALTTAQRELDRQRTDAQARLREQTTNKIDATTLQRMRLQAIPDAEQRMITDMDKKVKDSSKTSIFANDPKVGGIEPAVREDTMLSLMATNPYDPDKAARVLHNLTRAGEHSRERGYERKGLDANDNIIYILRDENGKLTGEPVHVLPHIARRISEIAEARTDQRIKRMKDEKAKKDAEAAVAAHSAQKEADRVDKAWREEMARVKDMHTPNPLAPNPDDLLRDAVRRQSQPPPSNPVTPRARN